MSQLAFAFLMTTFPATVLAQTSALKTENIRVRDPFIYADPKTSTYYLYAQAGNREGSGFQGVEVYTSTNLTEWAPPKPVLTLSADSDVAMVWAPEMHPYNNAYHLFVTLTLHSTVQSEKPVNAKNWPKMHKRGTWIYRSDSPAGPFLPLKNGPVTPPDWMSLDGTLFVENQTPLMVFCHEWVQLIDGTVDVVTLKPDLSDAAGTPTRLFRASDAPGAKTGPKEGKVTDGPFLYKSPKSGALIMTWSTFIPGKGYCVLQTRSESGLLVGPWRNHTPLYTTNGGHGMIFTTFDGRLLLALHQPNTGPLERLRLIELVDDGATLRTRD